MVELKANILIVDDKPEKILALEAVLEDLGQEIVRAYSGRDALRCLLNQDFAVVLLDVNMPGMDGFETASLIRQRASTHDVPIIFVTAYDDETHAARGYSLGAVDYIHAPVVPEVLRSKVAVFVELYRKNQQVRRQSESLRRKASQLQRLAEASLAISGAATIEKMFQAVADSAREVIVSHQAIAVFTDPRPGQRRSKSQTFASYSDKYDEWRMQPLQLDPIMRTLVFRSRATVRLTHEELRDHPDWDIVRQVRIPPIVGGILAAPLNARDGAHLGVIYLSDRDNGTAFTADDEIIAVQLAQLASIAIENLLFAEEREANRIKDEFLSMLSHELRTPLNAILGWTQLLRMENPQGEISHGLEVIERNARAQAKLVEDMLDVSRVTTGKLRLNRRPLSLEPIVQTAIEAIRPDAETKGLELRAVIERSDVKVYGDPDRIQQVVWNLLSNAVKFTNSGGRIELRLERVNGSMRICVSDTGRGISSEFLPYVFDRFRQADSSSTRAHGGLGLGLTIARQIIELHGGTVLAESGGDGLGSTFAVTLPVIVDTNVSTPAVADALAGNGKAQSRVASSSALRGVRALVIDDAPDTLEFLARVLRQAHIEVKTAMSADDGLAIFKQSRPDVVISDIAMPERDGYSLIASIRKLAESDGGQTPAIALTAYARDEDRCRALAAGFQMHIAKPIDAAAILTAVNQITTGRVEETAHP